MSIIKYSIENELFGSRNLNQNKHTGLSATLPNLKTIANTDTFTRRLPNILREHEFNLTRSQINKIFTAQWLDDRKVLMGTKCNKIVTLDTQTGKYSIQNPLKSHRKSVDVQNHCGIHSISINPSRTLLATGAEHVNDIAVYSLPSMEPVSVGYGAHSYWIFDFIWLDDQHVCSGAGDNRLALWRVDTDLSNTQSQVKLINSETEDSFTSSPSKLLSSRSKTNRNASLKRLLPSSSSSSSSSSTSSFFSLPTSSHRSFNTPHSPYNAFNTNTSFSSTFYPFSTTNASNSPSFLRPNRRSANSLNPFFSFRSNPQPTSRIEEIANETYYLNAYLSRQISEHDELSSNLAQNNDTNDLDLDEDDDDDQVDTDNDLTTGSDSSNSSNDLEWNLENPIASDLNEEDENNLSFSTTSTDPIDTNYLRIVLDDTDDEDEEYDDDDNEIGLKRRRLNSIGKYKISSGFKYQKPIKVIKCKQSKRIRALAFNLKRNEIAAISMNSAFHYFDIKRFEQKYTKKLSPLKENVCLTINSDYSIYAIGSASHVQLLDANTARALVQPVFIKRDIGIRSVHFRNDILSIGTGIGTVLFYDLRAHKFLCDPLETDPTNQLKLKTNGGWILRNESYYENLTYPHNSDNTHAIYAHSYDPSGTKLLTVGGPLTVNFHGHYAGVWR